MKGRFPIPPLGSAFVSQRMDGDALQAWLESLPVGHKPADSAFRLADLAEHLRLPNMGQRKLERLVELIADRAGTILKALDTFLLHPPVPLTSAHEKAYQAADRLMAEMAVSQIAIAERAPLRWLGLRSGNEAKRRIERALQFSARRIVLAYRVGARPPSDSWLSLHALYRTICDLGIENQHQEEFSASPKHTYLRTLLLALAEPSKLTAGMFDHVMFYVERHADLAELSVLPVNALRTLGDGHFIVDVRRPLPAQSARRAAEASLHGDWLLNCGPVLTQLSGQMAAVAAGVPPIKVGLPKAAEKPGYQQLLAYLAGSWGQPPTRRHTRNLFLPRADVMLGFPAIWLELGLNVTPDELEKRADRSHSGEWSIINESPLGYGLRFVSGTTGALFAGQLVGVRPHSGGPMLVGVLQRLHTGPRRSVEIGVEILAARPVRVTIPRDDDGMESIQALLLARSAQLNNQLAMAAEPGRLRPGVTFSVKVRERPATVRVVNRLPQGRSFDLFAVEVVRTRADRAVTTA